MIDISEKWHIKICLIITADKLTILKASLTAAYQAPNVSKELLTSLKLAECSAPAGAWRSTLS